MKNLTKNLTKNSSIDFINHQIIIEFTGGHYSEMLRVGNTHRVTVPYSCLSKKLQTIHRIGGKITNVSIQQLQLEMLDTNFEEIIAIAQPVDPATIDSAVKNSTEILTASISEVQEEVENILEESSEIVVETVPEILPDQIIEPIAEILVTPLVEPVVEDIIEPIVEPVTTFESATILSKAKKTKTSTKSGHGFNKPKDDIQPRSIRKPKS